VPDKEPKIPLGSITSTDYISIDEAAILSASFATRIGGFEDP